MKKILLVILFSCALLAQVTPPSLWKVTTDGNYQIVDTTKVLSFGKDATGYGFRQSSGTMQYRDRGGSWLSFPTSLTGGGWTLGSSKVYPTTAGNTVHIRASAEDSTGNALLNVYGNAYFGTSGTTQISLGVGGYIGVNSNLADDNLVIRAKGTGHLLLGYGDGSNGTFFYNGASTQVANIAGSSGNTWFNQGNVGIGTTSPLKALDVVGGIRTNDTLRIGDYGTYSWAKAGDLGFTTTSDEDKKTNIQPLTANLSKFGSVTPITYNYKEQNFIKDFDKTSVPDSVEQEIDSVKIKVSNKEEKDKKRDEFLSKNRKEAKAQSKLIHTGFTAQQFNGELFGNSKLDISTSEVIAVMWLKIQELEKRIEVLEAK